MAEDEQNQSGKKQPHILRASIKRRTLRKKNKKTDSTKTFSAGERRKKNHQKKSFNWKANRQHYQLPESERVKQSEKKKPLPARTSWKKDKTGRSGTSLWG